MRENYESSERERIEKKKEIGILSINGLRRCECDVWSFGFLPFFVATLQLCREKKTALKMRHDRMARSNSQLFFCRFFGVSSCHSFE